MPEEEPNVYKKHGVYWRSDTEETVPVRTKPAAGGGAEKVFIGKDFIGTTGDLTVEELATKYLREKNIKEHPKFR